MSAIKSKRPSKTNRTIRVTSPTRALVHDMIDTFNDLGADAMARIDARAWAKYYAKQAKKLGLR